MDKSLTFNLASLIEAGEFYPDIEVYEELEEDKLIFFEANESALLLIALGNEQNNSIYYDDIKIADSLEEFLIELMKNDKYYLDLIED
ncbi:MULTISPECIES: hypothetical protein [Bacillus]|uniref:hypothetical protein n=1 Tax=Bacillus sp. PBIB4 TaxID=3140353 RepID=UPI000AC2D6B1|nr:MULTISPECIES: hypothetical protein [Bacillus]